MRENIKTTAEQEYKIRKKLKKLINKGIKNPTLHDEYYENSMKNKSAYQIVVNIIS